MALRLPFDHEAYAQGGLPMFRSRVRTWSRVDVLTGIEALRGRASRIGEGNESKAAAPRWSLFIRDRAKFTMASIAAWAQGATPIAPAHARSPAMQREQHERVVVITDDADVVASAGETANVIDVSAWTGATGDVGASTAAGEASPLVSSGEWGADEAHDAIAWVFETSGSRGEATLHPRSRRAILAEAKVLADLLALRPGRTLVGTAPPTHLYGALFTIVAPLLAGCTVVSESPLHAGELVAALVETHASVLVSTPAHLAALMASAHGTLMDWTASRAFGGADHLDVVSSGAALPKGLAERIASLPHVRLTEILGATETGGIAWRRWPERRYLPLPGVRWRLHDDVFEVASPWCGAGDGTFVATREDVQLVDDDALVHHGRTDDVVKIGGRRVSLAALDEAIRARPGVEDVALTSMLDEGPRGAEIVGVLVAPGLSVSALLDELREKFDPVVIPRRLRHVARIERDERGKLPGEGVVAAWQQATPVDFELEMRACDDGTLQLVVPNTTAWTHGHFRQDAVIPGAALLAAITRAIEARLGGQTRELRGVKFHAKVAPGDALRVVLAPARQGGDVADSLRSVETLCSVEALRGDTMVLRAELLLDREASS